MSGKRFLLSIAVMLFGACGDALAQGTVTQPQLRMSELDGSPDVAVKKIVFPNGTLVNVSGVVTFSPTSGFVISALGYTPASRAGDTFTGTVTVPGFVIGSTFIVEDAASILALRNGSNEQNFRLYHSYTDAGNNEYGRIGWESNGFFLDTGFNGSGVSRQLRLRTNGASDILFYTNNTVRWHLNGSTGNLLPDVDNVQEIGSSSLRIKNIWAQTSVNIGTTVQSGLLNVGGNIVIDNTFGVRVKDSAATPITIFAVSGSNNVSYNTPTIGGSAIFSVNNASGAIQYILNSTERARLTQAGLLTFGGTTTSFPALKPSGAVLQVRFADDSNYTTMEASGLKVFGPSSSAVNMTVTADGTLRMQNAASNGFAMLQLGGTGNTVPGLKRNSNGLQLRAADDSIDTDFSAANLTASKTLITPPTTASQITANQNNYNSGGQSYFQRWSSDASRSVTGMTFTVTQVSGEQHMICNVGTNNIVLTHDDGASSTAANRFKFAGASNVTITADDCVMVIYDGTTQRWRRAQ